ncbi:MAG: selenocysteine-specific translation elongation factor [Anaerolineaceae bacterium 4572_32.2]|nr:MAG: selenocysteine-specific translation elongation factor [Anaerolineaceae bacterium 4572_32.2]
MHVIGTAGHVDHGKSTLVHALTGIDPDRLREEKEREMTIDLGFAWLALPNGESVGIVDVPGHRDFIENMLAGVGGIDAALFIVAADEGVMPQTREHLAILDLLGVERGVVALTKLDVLESMGESDEWVELVAADVSETLVGTALEGAPIVPVSARTGQGLDELTTALQEMLAQIEPRRDRGRPRLPVDRVFSISGFGTVVTGTLADGCFEVGQEVEILPRELKARVRGLQTHKQQVERAAPGSRVAMNLTGVSKAELVRGDVVTIPGWLHPTLLVDVQLRYLPDTLQSSSEPAHRPLRHNTQLKFFSGAAETVARVRILGEKTLLPGQTGWAQLRLYDPVTLVKGDRFIIRRPSPSATLGGGVVIDPNPGRKHRRFRPGVTARLETLAQGSPAEILLQALERKGPTLARNLLSASSLGDAAPDALAQLLDEEQALALGSRTTVQRPVPGNQLLAARSWWSALVDRILGELAAYHRQSPLRVGMVREALRSKLKLEPKVFNAVLARAVAEDLAVDEGTTVRLPSHKVQLDPDQQRRVDALLARFRRQPYTTPSVKESVAAVGESVLGVLMGRGDLVQLSPEVLFLPQTYEEMVSRVRAHIERDGSITLGETRDMLKTSRKYAQALLEHLDEIGVTKRVEDKRGLR